MNGRKEILPPSLAVGIHVKRRDSLYLHRLSVDILYIYKPTGTGWGVLGSEPSTWHFKSNLNKDFGIKNDFLQKTLTESLSCVARQLKTLCDICTLYCFVISNFDFSFTVGTYILRHACHKHKRPDSEKLCVGHTHYVTCGDRVYGT